MGGSRSSQDATVLAADSPEVVRAAGGLVVRRTGPGPWQVAVVHRPRRLDWTFPKGKVEPGEELEDCALREVREETGMACRLGPFVGHTEYRDRKDRPKVVAYWLMEPEGDAATAAQPADEAQPAGGVSPDEAQPADGASPDGAPLTDVPAGRTGPGDGEVDELRWADLGGAAALLSYERDRELLIALVALEEPDPED